MSPSRDARARVPCWSSTPPRGAEPEGYIAFAFGHSDNAPDLATKLTALHQALAWTHAEKIILNEFRRVGWHMGFYVDEPLSTYSMDLNYGPSVIDDTREGPDTYSPFFSCSDVGIAQHYGVPTRFLDRTFNPIFAVFFAQEDDAQVLDQTDLCVWALDWFKVHNLQK